MTVSNLVAMTGRVKTYLESPEKGTMPVSCTVYEYDNDLFAAMKYVDIALRGGAGINVILDKFVASSHNDFVQWAFCIDSNHADFNAIPSHLKDKNTQPIKKPFADVWINVNDSMEERGSEDGTRLNSIQGSWFLFYETLLNGLTPIVNLNHLRPNGSTNSKGLVASGAASFLGVYEAIAEYVRMGDIKSLMNVFGAMNDVLRRGGVQKNGIVLASLHYKHPDIIKYLNIPLAELKGSMKKSIRLDDGIVNDDRLMKLLAIRVNDKSMMTEKIQADGLYSNVCLSGDTMVLTRSGYYEIKSLAEQTVEVWNGERWSNAKFFMTSEEEQTYTVHLANGRQISATKYHRFIIADGTEKRLHELINGDKLLRHHVTIEGTESTKSAYLKGFLIADGTQHKGKPILCVYGDKGVCVDRLTDSCNETIPCNRGDKEISFLYSSSSNRLHMGGLSCRKQEIADWTKEFKTHLPLQEVLNWKSQYKADLIAGLFDGDASALKTKKGSLSYFLSSIHRSLLEDVQILLESMGMKSLITHHQPAGLKDFNDGYGEYPVKESYRLILPCEDSYKLSQVCKFERLKHCVIEPNASRAKLVYDSVALIEECDIEPVYCCNEPLLNQFSLANGIVTGNCKEILISSGGTCLLAHINLGQVESFDQIPQAMIETTELLIGIFQSWQRHPQYLDSDSDRQIGIGFIGLANLLARFGIKYKEFVEHLEAWLDPDREMSLVNNRIIDLCYAFEKGYYQASTIAKAAKLDRCWTIAPTQTSAYNHTDLDGNTTCKNINPPIKRRVQRQSQVMDSMNKWYYHGKVETMAEFLQSMPIDPVTGKDGVQRLWEAWQTMMDNTGLAHTMSFDLYRKVDVAWLKDFVLNSPLQTTYYMLADQIDQSHLNKGVALTASDAEQCAIDNQDGCIACAE